MKNHALILVFVALTLASCSTKRQAVEVSTTQEASDSSVFIQEVSIDTVVFQADSIVNDVQLEDLTEDTTISFTGGHVSTDIIVTDGVVSIKSTCDSLEQLVISYETRIAEYKDRSYSHSTNIEQTIIKEVAWYYKAALWYASLSLIIRGFKMVLKGSLRV